MKMNAMIMTEPGPAENFKFQEVEKPILRVGHLLVEVRATSVNHINTKVRGKLLPFSPKYPAILHVDFAGVVKEVQLGKHIGAIVHTTVSSEEDVELSKKLGADYAINYKTTSVEEYVSGRREKLF